MATFEEKLVTAVRAKREQRGLSLRALAGEVGVSFSTLARIERGDGQPDNNSKVRLLEWLGPDAERAGLSFDQVAFVHFRAGKNIGPTTVHHLLRAAECLRRELMQDDYVPSRDEHDDSLASPQVPILRSKEELEAMAQKFRKDLGLNCDQAIDSLDIAVEGVSVFFASNTSCLDRLTSRHLCETAETEWSAMSVPVDQRDGTWAILLNDKHSKERQRVTVLEEYWHIFLEHKLTKVAKIADAYGRTYEKNEEHDAFYLASATLLPREPVMKAILSGEPAQNIASKFGTSPELVGYRIKRLGIWREYAGKQVSLINRP